MSFITPLVHLLPVMLVIGVPGLLLAFLGWRGYFGPLFPYELKRLARSGYPSRLRVLTATLLLVAFFLTYLTWFPNSSLGSLLFASDQQLPLNEMASLTGNVLDFGVMLLLLVIYICMPAYAAGAITEERERRTLEYLFTTPLTDREIVLGKCAARIVHVMGILLTSLPILSLTQFWGGIDLTQLVLAYLVLGTTMIAVSGLALVAAVECRDLLHALALTYACVVGIEFTFSFITGLGVVISDILRVPWLPSLPVSLSPLFELVFVLNNRSEEAMPGVVFFMLFWGVVTLCTLSLATSRLRRAKVSSSSLQPSIPTAPTGEFPNAPPALQHRTRPEVDAARPLLWKEYHVTGLSPVGKGPSPDRVIEMIVLGYTAIGIIHLLLVHLITRPGQSEASRLAEVYNLILGYGLANFLLINLCMGLHACMVIARERQRGTLESLLTLPVTRSELLHAKWWGSWRPARFNLWFVIVMLGVAASIGAMHPLGSVTLMVYVLAMTTFMIAWGMWLSHHSRSTTSAIVYWLGTLFTFCTVPMLLGMFVRAMEGRNWLDQENASWAAFCESFNPVIVWTHAILPTQPFWLSQSALLGMGYVWIVSAILFGSAWLLWRHLVRSFTHNPLAPRDDQTSEREGIPPKPKVQ